MKHLTQLTAALLSIVVGVSYGDTVDEIIDGGAAIISLPCKDGKTTSNGCYICAYQGPMNVTIMCEIETPICSWKTCLLKSIELRFASPPKGSLNCGKIIIESYPTNWTERAGTFCNGIFVKFQDYKITEKDNAKYGLCKKKYTAALDETAKDLEKFDNSINFQNISARIVSLTSSVEKDKEELTNQEKTISNLVGQIALMDEKRNRLDRELQSMSNSVRLHRQQIADNTKASSIIHRIQQSRINKVATIDEAIVVIQDTIDEISKRPGMNKLVDNLKSDLQFLESKRNTVSTCTDYNREQGSLDYVEAWLCGDQKRIEEITSILDATIADREKDQSRLASDLSKVDIELQSTRLSHEASQKRISELNRSISTQEERLGYLQNIFSRENNFRNLINACYEEYHHCMKVGKEQTTIENKSCNRLPGGQA